MMPRDGAITFRDIVGKLAVLRVECDKRKVSRRFISLVCSGSGDVPDQASATATCLSRASSGLPALDLRWPRV
jgi:hypothetical protein